MPPEETPTPEDAYDRLAPSYESLENDPYRVDLEFPAMTELVPEVGGKRVLDAGCGGGRYAEWLIERGADVVAVDESSEMVERARRRIEDRGAVHQGDIGTALEFAEDDEFDGVVNLEDWRPAFAEFTRIFRPGGFLAFSTHHPLDDYVAFDAEDYFAIERERMTWTAGGEEVDVPFYEKRLNYPTFLCVRATNA